ncbi:MAG: regulatory protein RecX [Clostridia bacterium]|nr:regulatory protein RecX [Clostridia bacterium]
MISARDYALKIVGFKDRTEKEIREKLTGKGYDENTVEEETQFLKNYGFIDDSRYARHFTHDAINIKKWGKTRIKTELLRKGVDRETVENIIEDAFSELDDDRLFAEMQKRFKKSDFSNIKERTRIFNFYLRRGFSPNEIKGAMNRMCLFDDIICDD